MRSRSISIPLKRYEVFESRYGDRGTPLREIISVRKGVVKHFAHGGDPKDYKAESVENFRRYHHQIHPTIVSAMQAWKTGEAEVRPEPPPLVDYYRFEDKASYGDEIACGAPPCKTILRKLPVLKTTPKGVWIADKYGQDRFILEGGRVRYAYPTRELALKSFKRRKEVQVDILKRQLERAECALRLADEPFPIERPVVRDHGL